MDVTTHTHTHTCTYSHYSLLGHHHNFWRLEYVDLTGCVLVTDIAIQRVAQALGSLQHPLLSPLGCSCGRGGGRTAMTREIDGGSKGGGRRKKEEATEPQLKYLILSGCHLVTDVGLRWVWLSLVRFASVGSHARATVHRWGHKSPSTPEQQWASDFLWVQALCCTLISRAPMFIMQVEWDMSSLLIATFYHFPTVVVLQAWASLWIVAPSSVCCWLCK